MCFRPEGFIRRVLVMPRRGRMLVPLGVACHLLGRRRRPFGRIRPLSPTSPADPPGLVPDCPGPGREACSHRRPDSGEFRDEPDAAAASTDAAAIQGEGWGKPPPGPKGPPPKRFRPPLLRLPDVATDEMTAPAPPVGSVPMPYAPVAKAKPAFKAGAGSSIPGVPFTQTTILQALLLV